MSEPYHVILDHDHDLERTNTKESTRHDGRTVTLACQTDGCEYRRHEWRETATLTDFGGEQR